MRIYTKTGDKGSTQLLSGEKTSKSNPRLEAYGSIDELGAHAGLLLEHLRQISGFPEPRLQLLQQIQHELFNLGSELATPSAKIQIIQDILLTEDKIKDLEQDIDAMTGLLPQLRSFILSGGSLASAQAHVCRTVCRRAERHAVRLHEQEPVRLEALIYLNRLSDWFFTLARFALHSQGLPEVHWTKTQ